MEVTVLLDKKQQRGTYSDATYLYNNGIRTLIDYEHAIAHNKVIIVDGEKVITGSFNFSKAAEEDNAENLLILEGLPDVAAGYVENFDEHRGHCKDYAPPPAPGSADADAPPAPEEPEPAEPPMFEVH